MRRVTIAALAIVAMVGCAQEDSYSPDSSEVVNFSSADIGTRIDTTNNTWVDEDKIGITTSGFGAEYVNVQYEAEVETGKATTFSLVSGEREILYPNVAYNANNKVTFYAYYPYSNTEYDDSNNSVTIDVSNQKTDGLAQVDFLMATPVTQTYGNDYNTNAVDLQFDHRLSQVVFNIGVNDEVESLAGLTAEITGIETRGSYDLTDSDTAGTLSDIGSVELIVTAGATNAEASVTAILHPGTYTTPKLIFTLGEDRYATATFDVTLVANKSHTFTLDLGSDEVPLDNMSIGNWTSDGNTVTLVSEVNISFADANFKSALLSNDPTIDTDGDGMISYTEARAVTGLLDVSSNGISSMAEIKYFPNITELNCESNSLTELDLSACTKLEYLNCSDNSLTKLNISNCESLIKLFCNGNLLTELDLSDCAMLTLLQCYENRLSTLDVTMCGSVGYNSGSSGYDESFFYVGNQTSDGSNKQAIYVDITAAQGAYIVLTKIYPDEENYQVNLGTPDEY